MNESTRKNTLPAQGSGLEYTIYVFRKPENQNEPAGRWTRHSTMASLAQARKRALVLFRSGNYHRVEIKQKLFDRRQKRTVDITLKVIEQENTSLAARLFTRARGIFQKR
jgi:hypothetical protein